MMGGIEYGSLFCHCRSALILVLRFFLLLAVVVFLVFRSCSFIVASPIWSYASLFPSIFFLLSRLFFLVLTFTPFLSLSCIYPLMLKRKTKKFESARYVCIFIWYMYNVLGSAIITIIQLCGLCRLFVHSTLLLCYMAGIVVAIAWANIHHQPSKLCRSFFSLLFCWFFLFPCSGIAAVDSPIACFFFTLNFLFFVNVLFYIYVSVLHLLVYGWKTFAPSC